MNQTQYPNLFSEMQWDDEVRGTFNLLESLPSVKEIGKAKVVPFVGDKCLILQTDTGQWEIPGATLEADESHVDALQRELMEEAEAHLVLFEMIGAWQCHSTAAEPAHPHLPHPAFYCVAGYGDVEMVGQSQDSGGGNQQTGNVELVSVVEAAQRFRMQGRQELAELYELAASLRAQGREKDASGA